MTCFNVLEIERRLRFLLISPDSDDVFVFIDDHVLIVPYSQQYINTSFTTLGNRHLTDELSHQILNITSFGNAKGKILSQFHHAG